MDEDGAVASSAAPDDRGLFTRCLVGAAAQRSLVRSVAGSIDADRRGRGGPRVECARAGAGHSRDRPAPNLPLWLVGVMVQGSSLLLVAAGGVGIGLTVVAAVLGSAIVALIAGVAALATIVIGAVPGPLE